MRKWGFEMKTFTDYLARFYGIEYKEISLSNLSELQRLHMQHMPFENLDVIRKSTYLS